MRGQRRKPDRSKSGVHAKKSTTGLSDRESSFDAGKAVARVAKCVDRAGRRKAQWAEREGDAKNESRPISTACKHSEGCRCEQICSLNKKSQYRCCRGLVQHSRAATVGTSKETVDHGRGMAAASLLAVVCCSTKCWYQRSRTSRTAAAAFGFGNTVAYKPRSA